MENLRRLTLLSAIAISAWAPSAGAQERWGSYANPRFGTTADYPAHLFTIRDPPPENGDGQSFHTADGRAQLLIYGTRNVEGDTPQSFVEHYVDLAGVSYKRITARFYIVSGVRDGKLFYDRCNFPSVRDGVIDCLSISYPAQEKDAWDAIVARVSGSLRSGRGIEPRR